MGSNPTPSAIKTPITPPYAGARAAPTARGARASKNNKALTAYNPANTSSDSVYPPVRSTIQPRKSGESIIPAL